MAVSASGFIRFNGTNFESDCATTTDILGLFYCPGSPLRTNFIRKGDAGIIVLLNGTIRHSDCTTPYKKAKIELWHCDNAGVYDNATDEYRYRGTSFTDDGGNYSFNTILPVPYAQPNGNMCPPFYSLLLLMDICLLLHSYILQAINIFLQICIHLHQLLKKRILDVQELSDGSKKFLLM